MQVIGMAYRRREVLRFVSTSASGFVILMDDEMPGQMDGLEAGPGGLWRLGLVPIIICSVRASGRCDALAHPAASGDGRRGESNLLRWHGNHRDCLTHPPSNCLQTR